MIPDKMKQVLNNEGVVAIATGGEKGPHLVNTWNSYIQVIDGEHFLIPVGGMNDTEANLAKNNHVLITMGSREVQGNNGPGTGFLVDGQAEMVKSGQNYDTIKNKFPWARAALLVTVNSATQTL